MRDGKNFIYIDFSDFKTNDDFIRLARTVEPVITSYPRQSLYSIANIENVRFDPQSKKLIAEFMTHNKPYVRCGAIIGMDGIKKMLLSTVLKSAGRTNIHFAFTKERAVEWLLQQD